MYDVTISVDRNPINIAAEYKICDLVITFSRNSSGSWRTFRFDERDPVTSENLIKVAVSDTPTNWSSFNPSSSFSDISPGNQLDGVRLNWNYGEEGYTVDDFTLSFPPNSLSREKVSYIHLYYQYSDSGVIRTPRVVDIVLRQGASFSVSLSSDSAEFISDPETKTISYYSSVSLSSVSFCNSSGTAISDPGVYWLSGSISTSNHNITLTSTRNTSSVSRSGTVYILFTEDIQSNPRTAIAEIQVSQRGLQNGIVLNPSSISLLYSDVTNNNISIVKTGAGTVTVGSSSDFLTATIPDQSTLVVKSSVNTGNIGRTGTVVVTDGTYSATLTVNQGYNPGGFIIVESGSTLNFPNTETSLQSVVYIKDGNTLGWESRSGSNIVKSASYSSTYHSLTVTCNSNPSASSRSQTIRIYLVGEPGIYSDISITQTAGTHTISISTNKTFLEAVNGTSTITVTSNGSWNIGSSSGFLSFSPSSGTGNGTVTVTASDNISTDPRTATVTATSSATSSNTITFTQSGSIPASTDYFPIWRDYYYIFYEPSMQYRVKDENGVVIYDGLAYAIDSLSGKINISDIVKNFLTSRMVFNSGFVGNGGDDKFSFYKITSGGELKLYDYYVHNDWSYEPRDYSLGQILSTPINGHFDYRQFIPLTTYNIANKAYTLKLGNNTSSITYTSSPKTQSYCINGPGEGVEYVGLLDGGSERIVYNKLVCGKKYALIYRNRLAGWDSFLIEGETMKTDKVENDSYTRPFNNNDTTDFGTKTIHKRIVSGWKLITGWLRDEEAERLAFNLLPSPEVYLQDLEAGKFYSVNITNTSIEHKTFWNTGRQLVNYEIQIEDSQNKQFL